MASFKVYFISRSGHVHKGYVSARTKRLARRLARQRFDDVVAVKRNDGLTPGVRMLCILALLAVGGTACYFFLH